MCVSAMALKPFVFHLHRYCWNVLLLAFASVLLSLCGCVCVQGRDVHTLLEDFPVFVVHPQTACTITNSFFSTVELGSSQILKKRTDIQKESGGRDKIWLNKVNFTSVLLSYGGGGVTKTLSGKQQHSVNSTRCSSNNNSGPHGWVPSDKWMSLFQKEKLHPSITLYFHLPRLISLKDHSLGTSWWIISRFNGKC